MSTQQLSKVRVVAIDLLSLLEEKDVEFSQGVAGLAMALVMSAMSEEGEPDNKELFMQSIETTWDLMRKVKYNEPTVQ
jgi:hypothetical protein